MSWFAGGKPITTALNIHRNMSDTSNETGNWQPPDPEEWKAPGTGTEGESPLPPEVEASLRYLEGSIARRDAAIAARKAAGEDFNAWLKTLVAESWARGPYTLFIAQNHETKAWCGYVRFPVRPVKETRYGGILQYVPVHGGITYAEDSPDGSMVYGFDCGHAQDRRWLSSEEFKRRLKRFKRGKTRRGRTHMLLGEPIRRTRRWLWQQCETMAGSILVAAQFEDAYLASEGDQYKRAAVLDKFHEYLSREKFGQFVLTDNFLAMINVLAGRL